MAGVSGWETFLRAELNSLCKDRNPGDQSVSDIHKNEAGSHNSFLFVTW